MQCLGTMRGVRRTAPPGVAPGAAALLLVVGSAGLTACGSGDRATDGGGVPDRPTLTVQAAASLTGPLTACAEDYGPAELRLSFAGSDELAAQIRQGAGGDLYAAANAALPGVLAKEGRLRTPVAFARNELVLAVPTEATKVASLDDLAADDDLRLAVGAPSVPVGSYTREALGRLPKAQRDVVLDRVRTEEPDVRSVLAKLQQGVVDAALVYRTDVRTVQDDVRAVALPAAVRPRVSYEAAVVAGTRHASAAAALLEDLRTGGCSKALRSAGFLAPGATG